MKHSKTVGLLVLIFLNCLQLLAVPRLNFDDFSIESEAEGSFLLSLQGQVVQVRGFWYPLSSDEGILSSQPGLKSCCLKAPAKIKQQIIVKGSLASLPAQRALTMQGVFKMESHYQNGERVQFFVLEQAEEVSQSSWNFGLIFFIVFICLIFFIRKAKV